MTFVGAMKILITNIFSFSHYVYKGRIFQTCQNFRGPCSSADRVEVLRRGGHCFEPQTRLIFLLMMVVAIGFIPLSRCPLFQQW